jgi:protein O-mannosyl-transferase
MTIPSALLPSSSRRWFLGVALVLLLTLVYLRALSGEFIWDDENHVAANPTIVGPLGLTEIWTTARANYFPLVLTNFWLQHAVWGLNPFGYHVVTLAFHLGAVLLLWGVLRQLRVPGAWLGAALWGLHPVQVESVAWISELKNTQSAVAFLLAILFFLRWSEQPRSVVAAGAPGGPAAGPVAAEAAPRSRGRGFYFLALGCALLALLSKPSTVMLPAALALGLWWQRRRFAWRDVIGLAPFLALSAFAAGWAIWEQKFHSGAVGPEWSQTPAERALIAGRVVWFYLGKLAWPQALSFVYSRWSIHAGSVAAWLPLALAIVALGWLWHARHGPLRPVAFAAAYFVALLFPVLGFFDVYFFRYSYVGDHFQYLASMGPLALAGAGLARLAGKHARLLAGALLLALGGMTWRQTEIYHDNTTLWRATVTRTPDAEMAWLNLGDVYSWAQRYPESIAAYREAIRLRPTDPDGHNNLGNVLTLAGDPAAAVSELERALALKPDFATAHFNLGNALRAVDRHAEAIAHYAEAIRLVPDYPAAHNNLAVELSEAGRPGEAIPHFEQALRAKPGAMSTRESVLRALDRYGRELAAGGRWADAAANARRALELEPRAVPVREALAVALTNLAQLAEAVRVLEEGVRLDPNSAALHDDLGRLLRSLGRNREALEQFELAAKLRDAAPPRR